MKKKKGKGSERVKEGIERKARGWEEKEKHKLERKGGNKVRGCYNVTL